MSRHNTIRATLAVTAAAFALGAGSAGAMPIRDGSPALHKGTHVAQFYDAGHASLAIEQAQTQAAAQDKAHLVAGADMRSPDARDAALVASRHDGGKAQQPVLQGPPQFSTTKVAALHSTQPVNNSNDNGDVPLLGFILGLAGAGLLGVGGAYAVSKSTRSRRTRVTA